MFARMANEQCMKYLSSRHKGFWDHIRPHIVASKEEKDKIIKEQLNDDPGIRIPGRIDALKKIGVLNELIAKEVELVNKRGNNVAHSGRATPFWTCYHNLELLDYLYKYCK